MGRLKCVFHRITSLPRKYEMGISPQRNLDVDGEENGNHSLIGETRSKWRTHFTPVLLDGMLSFCINVFSDPNHGESHTPPFLPEYGG